MTVELDSLTGSFIIQFCESGRIWQKSTKVQFLVIWLLRGFKEWEEWVVSRVLMFFFIWSKTGEYLSDFVTRLKLYWGFSQNMAMWYKIIQLLIFFLKKILTHIYILSMKKFLNTYHFWGKYSNFLIRVYFNHGMYFVFEIARMVLATGRIYVSYTVILTFDTKKDYCHC